MLLDHGAKVNARNSYGSTPLHDAALSGQRQIVEMLLERGAEIDARDQDSGATPLYNAASWGKLDVVRLLMEKGADINVRTKVGKTPVAAAEENGFPDVAAALRARGAK
jgi:ankyrin repeat protein